MLNLNDDMEDLIRQAADDYPLKIDTGDWDRVVGGMQSAVQSTPTNGKKYWWLLLLLLPLIVAILLINKNNSTQQQSSTYSNKKTATATTQNQNSNTADSKQNELPVQANTGDSTASHSNKARQKEESDNLQEQTRLTATTKKVINNRNVVSVSETERKIKKNFPDKNSSKNDNTPVTNETVDDTYNGDKSASDNSNHSTVEDTMGTTVREKQNSNTEEQKSSVATADAKSSNKVSNTPQNDSAATVKKTSTKLKAFKKRTGLYVGIAAALDVSSVKLNKTKELGYSGSFVVGYRINNNWSVESGLMWDSKNYYSPGKYFDKSKTGIPTVSYIHFLEGTCRMYEVPLNIKFDFNSKRMSSFYVSAGLSSYFMNKEDYDYHATNTVTGNYYVGHKEYKNSTNNLFSVANISGGYQFNFKNNNSLRIEPYLKVPLKGLGIGKLPFSSTGISAAYTLPLR
jgi:FtsZ-interacting cell division protein ZipA